MLLSGRFQFSTLSVSDSLCTCERTPRFGDSIKGLVVVAKPYMFFNKSQLPSFKLESPSHLSRRTESSPTASSAASRNRSEMTFNEHVPVNNDAEEDVDMNLDDVLDESETEVETPSPAAATDKGKRKVTGKCGNKRGVKKLRSPVWAHFTKTKNNPQKAKCHYYGKLMGCISTSGTSNMRKHLFSCKEYKAWKATQQEGQQVINPESDGSLQVYRVSEAVFREATNEMLVLGELLLAFIESLAWRHFCKKMQLYTPVSRRTATRDIVEMFVKRKNMMKKLLSGKKQRVSLTTDIWTAPTTGASYMVVTAHFIDGN